MRSIFASRISPWLVASTAVALIGGCSNDGAKLAGSEKPVVYGEDNRQDVYAYADQAWATRAAEFTAAMIGGDAIDQSDPSNVRIIADTLTDAFGVCDDERFGPQLTAASCSATLIAPDLVLTAGHCMTGAAACAQYSFVFDYYMTDATTLHSITSDDVYPCQEIVVRAQTSGTPSLDYAIVRLDRPVAGRVPAPVDSAAIALPAATPLIVNGYGSGLPLKIDNGASVRDNRTANLDFFVANLDTFGGNSGSGVFRTDTGRLVGILVRGETDYVQDPSGCTRVNVCPETGCRGEDSTYAFNAIAALCELGPDPTLCACGDGVCDGDIGETSATCAADCGTVCGDGACNGDESPTSCSQDCGTCGNGVCDGTETSADCCTDCACDAGNICRSNTCAPDPGPGDTCDSAIAMPPTGTQVVTGTTTTAYDDYSGTCVGAAAPERVYSFTVTRQTQLDVTAIGYDTGLYLRSNCAAASSQVSCNDDSTPPGNFGSHIAADLAPGTYYLFIDGYTNSDGDYTVTAIFTSDCVDTDGDGVCDDEDECPEDPGKDDPGQCGCGELETDTDSDGLPDCKDECPEDPAKEEAGQCGCGVAETDTDSDGLPDCKDACPEDPAKEEPGVCGCGVADTNTDGDSALDCQEECDEDPAKTEPGICGCGTADTDTDSDGTADCVDSCPADPAKTEPGVCGCGTPDTDGDGDGRADCVDSCPADPAKTEPGVCGCGTADTDTDGDGTADCLDTCPMDPAKTEPGVCGCGTADTNTDGDGALDCQETCDADPAKTEPGVCGCGTADTDTDGDGTADCVDTCPTDPNNDCNDPPDDGCGCSSTGNGSTASALFMMGLVAVGLRRRRRA